MTTVCAECQKEGKRTIMSISSGYGVSHGLCHYHYLKTLVDNDLATQEEQDEFSLLKQRQTDERIYNIAHESYYSHVKHCQQCCGKSSHHDFCNEGQARYFTMCIPKDRIMKYFSEKSI